MSFDAKHLYELLPVLYRLRDAGQGEPLKALIAVIAEQAGVLEDNLDQLYDDLFIETSAEWVVPYIGDLIGYRLLHGVTPKISNRRAEVANTIRYRRRKGAAYVLGLLARDVTGWPARTVEFFRLLGQTQHMKHIRAGNPRCPDLHGWQAAEEMDTAFDETTRTVDVRRIASGRGRYNILNVGIFVWRLRPYPISKGTPHKIADHTFTFDPLGRDIQLFNSAAQAEDIAQVVGPHNVPAALSRRRLFDELEARRQATASSKPVPVPAYFGASPPFTIYKNGVKIPVDQIQICNLSDWTLPNAVKQYSVDPLDLNSSTVGLPIQVAVDLEMGRMAFAAAVDVPVEVDFVYGFSGDYGAGPYARRTYVHNPAALHVPTNTIAAALTTVGASSGIVEIDDSHTYTGGITLTLSADQTITFQAADRTRPCIDGKIHINTAPRSAVVLDGLFLGQGIEIVGRDDCTVTIANCSAHTVTWTATGGGRLTLDHSITGELMVDEEVAVSAQDSVIDAGDATLLAIAKTAALPCGQVDLARCTVMGRVEARETVLIENSILTGIARFARRQSGCVRFSDLPAGSETPRQYQCTSLLPVFTSTSYSRAAYLQLSKTCPVEISEGADDGSEMGVFHDLFQPQRKSNLATRLDEYLKVGLEAAVIFEN